MSKPQLTVDLDRLINRAAAVKATKLASAIDTDDDKTTQDIPEGEHAKANREAAGASTGPAGVDGGATTNPENASVENSTDGAVAGSTDGTSGPKTRQRVTTEGPMSGDEALRAVKEKIASLRKAAHELRKVAEETLPPFDRFLAYTLRTTPNSEFNKIASQVDTETAADAAAQILTEAVQSGRMTDEDAAAILKEAAACGALTPHDFEEAANIVKAAEVPTAVAEGGSTVSDVDAEAAGQAVLDSIANNQLSDDEAAAILQQAVNDGLVTEQELVEAADMVTQAENVIAEGGGDSGGGDDEKLLAAVESGQLSDEEAAAILTNLVESGALTQQELDDAAAAASAAEEEADKQLLAGLESGEISDEEAAVILQNGSNAGYFTKDDFSSASELLTNAEADAGRLLLSAIESGALSDAEAEQILSVAVQGGMISPEELTEAESVVNGAEAQLANSELNASEEMAKEAHLKKVAEALPGEPHYEEKLLTFCREDAQRGYDLFVKVAEAVTEEAKKSNNSSNSDSNTKESDDPMSKKNIQKAVSSMMSDKGGTDGGQQQTVSVDMSEVERRALAEVQQELGLSDEQMATLLAQDVTDKKNDKESVQKVASAYIDQVKNNIKTQIIKKLASML